MNVAGDAGHTEDEGSMQARMRARMSSARERWAALPRRRKIGIIAIALLVFALVVRRRGAPLVQVHVDLTFRPVAVTAVSLFGEASADAGTQSN